MSVEQPAASPPQTSASPPQLPNAPVADSPQEARTREYGLIAVLAGLAVLAILDAVVLVMFHENPSTTIGIIGAIDSPIGVLVSAYFGMKVGADSGNAGRIAAEQARNQATQQAVSFAAHLPPEIAKPALREFGIPVAS